MTDDIIPPKPLQGRYTPRDHEHKWFPWQTKTPFEPAKTEDGVTYWIQTEYAYLNCNCGAVVRIPVKTKEE